MKRILALAVVAVSSLGYASTAHADVCDLTTAGSTCGPAVYGAIYSNVLPQPTGTGYIDPFLRLQNTGIEQGYNTSADFKPGGGLDFQFDQKDPINYTHDLLLSDVPIVTKNGVDYREFWLDINEAGSADKHLLSLDKLQIFLSPVGMLGVRNSANDPGTGYQNGMLNNLPAIYDLDSGKDNTILLDYNLGSGSGSGDMVVYIPNSLFVGGSYVYLYSMFGATTGAGADLGANTSDAGFEEWWVKKSNGSTPNPPVPEPGTWLLVGSGLAVAAARLRKRA